MCTLKGDAEVLLGEPLWLAPPPRSPCQPLGVWVTTCVGPWGRQVKHSVCVCARVVSGVLSKLGRAAETKQAACCTLRCLFAELGAVLPRLAPLPTGFRFQAI